MANPSVMDWDADGNRVGFTSSTGGAYTFVYDITAGIPAVIEEITPQGTIVYVREPNGALIARIDTSASTTHVYHFDALGNTRFLTSGGAVTDTYTYDAWGNVSHDSGSTQQPYQYVGRLGYYTHYQDANLDLLHLGVRFYDPEIGRFTQRDSIRFTGVSDYVYADCRPSLLVDPSGEDWRDWMGRAWCIGRFVSKFVGALGGAYFTGWICKAGYQSYKATKSFAPGGIARKLAQQCLADFPGRQQEWVTVKQEGVTYLYRCWTEDCVYRLNEKNCEWEPIQIEPHPITFLSST